MNRSIRLLLLGVCFALGTPFFASQASAASPTIQIDPSIGEINTQITVTGQNFAVGANVQIFIGTSTSELADAVYSATTVEENGTFKTSFVMPGTWPTGEPITNRNLMIVAKDVANSVQASAAFMFIAPPLESIGWRRFSNEKFGFTLMLPPGWIMQDNGNGFTILIEDNPQAGQITSILTPATQIEGGKDANVEVHNLALEDYAKIALSYELGGAGTFILQKIESFQTEIGYPCIWAYWQFKSSPLSSELSATKTDAQTPNAPAVTNYVAAYFDLNAERDGMFYRALEFVSVVGQQPTPNLFKSMMNSVVVSLPMMQPERVTLQSAIADYLKQMGTLTNKYFVAVTGLEADFVRFELIPETPAQTDTATGFAKRSKKSWTILAIGTQFDDEFYNAQGIPDALQK
jgi:hypothetical protein